MRAEKTIEDLIQDEAFWASIAALMAKRMAPLSLRAFLMGIDAASATGVIVDFAAVHAPALQMARETSSVWWGKMAETTRESLRQALTSFIETGVVTPAQQRRGLPTLIEGLQPMFDRARAARIAATETTRLFAEGNRLASRYDESVGGEQWQTARDDKVCPICGPRDGKIWPKGQGPEMPAHVACRCAYAPASWSYVRQHPSKWQGGTLLPEGV